MGDVLVLADHSFGAWSAGGSSQLPAHVGRGAGDDEGDNPDRHQHEIAQRARKLRIAGHIKNPTGCSNGGSSFAVPWAMIII